MTNKEMTNKEMREVLLNAARYNKDRAFESLYINLSASFLSNTPKMKTEFCEVPDSWYKKIGDYRISLYEDFIVNLKDDYVKRIYDFLTYADSIFNNATFPSIEQLLSSPKPIIENGTKDI